MAPAPFPYSPAAVWQNLSPLDMWAWLPTREAEASGPQTEQQLRQAGYVPVDGDQHPTRLLALTSQLSNLRYIAAPGSEQVVPWAPIEAIEYADARPVVLTFRLPQTGEKIEGAHSLGIVCPLPPPQIGEMAMVADGEQWRPLRLAVLGSDALTVWQQLGGTLKRLAAPAEWWPYSQLYALCGDPATYQETRKRLDARLKTLPAGPARETMQQHIYELKLARQRLERVRTSQRRAQRDQQTLQKHWQMAQDLARLLAGMYWDAYQRGAESDSLAQDEGLEISAATIGVDGGMGEGAGDDMAAAVVTDEDREQAEDRARLALISEVNSAPALVVSNHFEDRAVREAVLAAQPSAERLKREKEGKADPLESVTEALGGWVLESTGDEDPKTKKDKRTVRFTSSDNLGVYLFDRDNALPEEQALEKLREYSERTVLTGRIANGLWNVRRHDNRLAKNGSAVVRVDEVLAWRGNEKQKRHAYPEATNNGSAALTTTDGYRTEQKEAIRRDLLLLSSIYLKGRVTARVNGKEKTYDVDGQYMRVSTITDKTLWNTEEIVGFYVSPGDWINHREDDGLHFWALLDRSIFQLNPQNEQHELRLALYLSEEWRRNTHRRGYDKPYVMADLLARSIITVDKRNLTNRFIPRIEMALATLKERGIIGDYDHPPIDRTKRQWGIDWLASQWRILPPTELREYYRVNVGEAPRQLPPGPHQQTRKRTRSGNKQA